MSHHLGLFRHAGPCRHPGGGRGPVQTVTERLPRITAFLAAVSPEWLVCAASLALLGWCAVVARSLGCPC